MILRAFLMLFWLFAATPTLAQTVAIRSGEHPDFSRVVFETPTPEPWSLGRDNDGYLLRFANADLSFDTSRVFDRIPRLRLVEIGLTAPGSIRLDVSENVHAKAFLLRPGVLVVDLYTGPAPVDSPFEEPLDHAAVASSPPVQLPMDVGRRPPVQVIGEFVSPVADPVSTDSRVASARSELMRQIGRAASQGLLDPALAPGRSEPPEPVVPPTPPDANPVPLLNALQRSNMQIETSIDRGLVPDGKADTEQGKPCLPDAYFDLTAWGADHPPGALIAQRRAALVTVRDRADPAAAAELARAYLALGFGAEALMVLRVFAIDTPGASVWREMASILDNGRAMHPGLFDGQLSCPSRVALWAAMARADLPPGDGLDTAAVIRSFSELAPHLRRHLGPALAERFLAAGDLSTATGIRNAIARSGDATRSEELTLVEARLDLSHGEDAVADARIDDVLSQGGRATPDALVLRLETELATGQPPAPDDIGLAEALAFERRGTALGARLLSLAIRGHGALGDFATAFRLLAHHGLEGQQDLASALVLGLARDGADADMLYQAYAGALTHPDLAASPEAWLAVADRMTRLGFAQRAEEILAGIAPQGSTEERLVRARLALAGNRPGQAQQYLGGLDGSQADVLRGEAAQRQGDLKAAADYFGAAGQTGRQSALSWRARDWDAVQAVGGEARVALAAERAQARTAELPQEPSLAAARAVLADSARMRDRLRGVLGAAVPQP